MFQMHKVLTSLCTGCFCTIAFHQLPVIGQVLLPRTEPMTEAIEMLQAEETSVPIATQLTGDPLPVPPKEPVYTAPDNIYPANKITTTEAVPIATPTLTTHMVTTVTETITTSESAVTTTDTATAQEVYSPEEAKAASPEEITETATITDIPSLTPYPLDTYPTWFKAYMDYRTITDTSSTQYALQQLAWTDANGLRRYGDDYLVAMGTGWLESGCGERFLVTLESGAQFTITVGDIKADCHTDATHRFRACGGGANVLEFIVDTDVLSSEAVQAGTVSVYPALSGNLQSLERLSTSVDVQIP